MARYIDADAVMKEIRRIGGHNLSGWDTIGVKALICRQPTADVVEVRHGQWVQNEHYTTIYKCSECGRHIEARCDPEVPYPYCHCGAKMDGRREQ